MTSITGAEPLAGSRADAKPAYVLKRGMLAAFVGPCLPFAALGLPLVVFLPPFYASYVGVPLAVVGAVFMLLRLADIVVDPVLGALMDGTRSRFGRFRPWLVASTPILMVGSYAIFMAEKGAGAAHLAIWLGVLYVGYSMAVLSQTAWAGVLSAGYHERSRVYAWWQSANVIGMVLVLALPAVVQSLDPGEPAAGIRAMGWLVVVLLPITIAIAAWRTPEPAAPLLRPSVDWRTYMRLMKRPALARILTADFLLSMAGGTTGALFLFFIHDAKGFSPAQSQILLLIYFLGGLAGTPVWTYLARRFGKHRALTATCAYYLFSQLGVQLIPGGSMALAIPGLFIAGLAYASAPILLRAMTADAGDEARLDTGEDRTGVLYALVTSTSKVGYALAVGVSYPLLSWVGYDAKAGAGNSAAAVQGLQLIFVLTPVILAILTALVANGYKLDAKRHAAVRDALDARDKAAADATAVPGMP